MGHGIAVEVDRPQILAEAAAAAAEAPAELGAPAAGQLEVSATAPAPAGDIPQAVNVAGMAADVAPALRGLVAQGCAAFMPAWEVSRVESDGVADAAALVLAYWMPAGAIEPKYVALISLAGALYGVASARRNPDGTWVPLRRPPAPKTPPPAPGAAGSNVTPLRV